MDTERTVSGIVRAFMTDHGLSYRQMAAKLSEIYYISHVSVERWAKGDAKPTHHRIRFYAANTDDDTLKMFFNDLLVALGREPQP